MKPICLPCCYHPTTILLVDDDELFVSAVANHILSYTECKVMGNPLQVKYALEHGSLETFLDRCKKAPEQDFEDHNIKLIENIQREVFNPKRFEQISVVLVDYQMPSMNGLELCAIIRDLAPHIKIIMLTGEADHDIAVKAFNAGTIDRFIKKSEWSLPKVLKTTIQELQWQYFVSLSQKLIDNFITNTNDQLPVYFQNPAFKEFIQKFCQSQKACEFYILDTCANFMLVKRNGDLDWLLVRNEDDMITETVFAEEFSIGYSSPQIDIIIETLRNRKHSTFFLTREDNALSINEWAKLLYPLTRVTIDNAPFYYALIANNKMHFQEPFVTYDQSLEERGLL